MLIKICLILWRLDILVYIALYKCIHLTRTLNYTSYPTIAYNILGVTLNKKFR